MQPGVYPDLSNAEYHGGPGVSKSILDLVARSPMHAKCRLDAANDNAPTTAQAFGTAFHTLILEPHLFVSNYTLPLRQSDVPEAIADKDVLLEKIAELNKHRLPKHPVSGSKAELIARIASDSNANSITSEFLNECNAGQLKDILIELNNNRSGLLSTSGTIPELAQTLRDAGIPITLWQDVKAEWLQNNGHRIVLTQDDYEALQGMRASVQAHPAADTLLYGRPGRAEQSVYWNDIATGELCRCRPDFWREDNVIVDLKSTEDASPEGFAKSIVNWSYYKQDAFYTDGVHAATGLPVKAFVFVAVEKKPPYAVGVYMLDAVGRELGRIEYMRDLAVWAECRRTGVWPGYSEKIEPISLPAWHTNKNQELLTAA